MPRIIIRAGAVEGLPVPVDRAGRVTAPTLAATANMAVMEARGLALAALARVAGRGPAALVVFRAAAAAEVAGPTAHCRAQMAKSLSRTLRNRSPNQQVLRSWVRPCWHLGQFICGDVRPGVLCVSRYNQRFAVKRKTTIRPFSQCHVDGRERHEGPHSRCRLVSSKTPARIHRAESNAKTQDNNDVERR